MAFVGAIKFSNTICLLSGKMVIHIYRIYNLQIFIIQINRKINFILNKDYDFLSAGAGPAIISSCSNAV